MKHYKIFLTLITSLMFLCFSCQDDENLNLRTYNENRPLISIEGGDKGKDVVVKAFYDEEGILQLNDKISRTFSIDFETSLEDIEVYFDIYSKNIPGELVSIDKTKDTIPAGYTQAAVTITLKDEDFSFAQSKLDKEDYELGIITYAKGSKMTKDSVISKVFIEKEPFLLNCKIVGEDGSATEFERTYNRGQILNEQPMQFSFRVQVDKPTLENTTVKLLMTGVDDAFKHTVTMPKEVVIAKGKKTSDIISWSITDDFLLQTDEAEEYVLTLSTESENPLVAQPESDASQELKVHKVLRNIFFREEMNSDWLSISKDGWDIELLFNSFFNKNILIDGKGGPSGSYVSQMDNNSYSFIIDMSKEQSIKGVGVDYNVPWGYSLCPKRIKIATSIDNVNWIEQGDLNNIPLIISHYVEFYTSVKTRYVKFDLLEPQVGNIQATEVYIYK